MLSMKKGLAALVAACFLFIGGGQAQAVVGIPDDVPANTLLYPFFKVTSTASGTQDTLFVVTNTDTTQPQTAHVIVWSVKSVHVYDFNINLTPGDVWSCSLRDLIVTGAGCAEVPPAPPVVRTQLLTTLSTGETLLAGYVTVEAVSFATSLLPTDSGYPRDDDNILIGHEYIVNLPAGSATGLNAVSIEYVSLGNLSELGQPAVGFGIINGGGSSDTATGFFTSTDGLERINGREGDIAQTGDAQLDDWWQIIRYFTASVPGLTVETELWLWKDSNLADASVNVSMYDEAEVFHSVTLPLPLEVNFINIRDFITPGAPGGWFRIPHGSETQSVAYSLQLANDASAVLRWDAIFPAHRQYTQFN